MPKIFLETYVETVERSYCFSRPEYLIAAQHMDADDTYREKTRAASDRVSEECDAAGTTVTVAQLDRALALIRADMYADHLHELCDVRGFRKHVLVVLPSGREMHEVLQNNGCLKYVFADEESE
jgi:hypothetical protein